MIFIAAQSAMPARQVAWVRTNIGMVHVYVYIDH